MGMGGLPGGCGGEDTSTKSFSVQLISWYGGVMPEPRWLDAEEQRAWRAFIEAARLLLDQLDRELQRDAGMPHAYYEILVRLSEQADRALRMSELADRSQSSRSRVSHAIARLEEKGW